MSLLSPLFLLGLAALAAPIIVHLVRRTRAPLVEFPSLMFVRKVPQRTIRRKRLHNLLLLLLRSLAIMLAVLAFARPFFEGDGAAALQSDRSNLILIDASLSMRYGNRSEQAKARARAILDDISGEKSALVTFGQDFEILSRLTTDAEKLRSQIDLLEPGLGATDYEQALRATENVFAEAGKGERRIFLISDFQASGRTVGEGGYRLPREIKLLGVDVGEGYAPNLAIVEVGAHPVIYQQKYTDKINVRVANFSDEDRSGIRVELSINDHVVEKRELRIPARGVESVEFTGFNLSDGVNRCLATISDDAFAPDNRYFFTIKRAEQYKALVIETAVRGQSESFFLKNALTAGENLPFSLTVKSAGSVNPGELGSYRVVILNDPADLSDAVAGQLLKFTEAGGGLIIATGPHARADVFNRQFGTLAPAKLQEPVQARSDYAVFSEIKTDHPVFEIFRESGRVSATRFFGYHRSTPGEKSSVLARFGDGSPALVEGAHGKGKVLLFTSTLDSTWNDMPLSPIYLPLVRQAVRHLGERDEKTSYPVGKPLTAPPAQDGTLPAVDSPSGVRITERAETPLGDLIVNPRETGFYRLRYPGAPAFVAVNVDGRESDLTRLDVNEFVASVSSGNQGASGASAGAAEAKPSREEIEGKQRVWWLLLLASMLLFVSEAVIARRMKTARIIN